MKHHRQSAQILQYICGCKGVINTYTLTQIYTHTHTIVWDRADYLLEAVKLGDNKLNKLMEESNRMFERLLSKKTYFNRSTFHII